MAYFPCHFANADAFGEFLPRQLNLVGLGPRLAPESYAGPPMLFLARSPAISSSEEPAPASTSSVCSPSSGDG